MVFGVLVCFIGTVRKYAIARPRPSVAFDGITEYARIKRKYFVV